MHNMFAISEFLDSEQLHGSIALFGAALGFWAGTKVRNVSGETGLPGMGAIVGALLFYLLAKFIAATAIFVSAGAIVIWLILSWPTVSKVVLIFANRLALLLPTSFYMRSLQKQLAAEQDRHERELELTRGLRTDPATKQRLIEKLEEDHRRRLIELADRHQSKRE